jgi:hypothetical protein
MPAIPVCAYDPQFEVPENWERDFDGPRWAWGRTPVLFVPPEDWDGNFERAQPDLAKAKRVYRAIENLAGLSSRPHLQRRAFIRRKDIQRRQYKQGTKSDDGRLDWVVNPILQVRASLARWILLYGESPWRIIGWSLAVIFGFALLYPLGGWMKPEDGSPITYSLGGNPLEFGNSIYYSTLTFTALGFGDFQPVGFGRVLTTIETGLGAVLLALLVFVLGRRATR